MAKYLDRIIAARDFGTLDDIITEADGDRAITDAQAEYITKFAIQRGTVLLFGV